MEGVTEVPICRGFRLRRSPRRHFEGTLREQRELRCRRSRAFMSRPDRRHGQYKPSLDVPRRRSADHSERAEGQPDLPLVNRGRRLHLQIVADSPNRWFRRPRRSRSSRIRTCGRAATSKKRSERRCLSRVPLPVSRLPASIVRSPSPSVSRFEQRVSDGRCQSGAVAPGVAAAARDAWQ